MSHIPWKDVCMIFPGTHPRRGGSQNSKRSPPGEYLSLAILVKPMFQLCGILHGLQSCSRQEVSGQQLTIFKGALIHRPPPSLAFGPASLSRQQGKVRTKDHHLWSTHLFRSSSSKDQKILMSPPHPPFFDLSRSLEVVWTSSESYSSSFVLLSSCLSVFLSFCLNINVAFN